MQVSARAEQQFVIQIILIRLIKKSAAQRQWVFLADLLAQTGT